ncbi:LptA/OstA family protein [Scleromatobacter humisilvae]|uniref:LptA/OstA family protein n=1 Tax=Scleromatobacter humisilvae TaxID=2897159 RepID=UPI003B84A1EB
MPGRRARRARRPPQGKTAVTAADATTDRARQTADFSGDVVITQGTRGIRADREQRHRGANGARRGFASGKTGVPVRFRQHGDRPGERSEGQAERVEVDSVANEVRLIGAASLRNLSGTVVTPSVQGRPSPATRRATRSRRRAPSSARCRPTQAGPRSAWRSSSRRPSRRRRTRRPRAEV